MRPLLTPDQPTDMPATCGQAMRPDRRRGLALVLRTANGSSVKFTEIIGLATLKPRTDFCRRVLVRESLMWNRGVAALVLSLLSLLMMSGMGMALYYSPVPGTAYDSVDYAQFKLPFGSVIRGIHYYAWNVLLMVMVMHLVRTLMVGAYRAQPKSAWVMGIGLGCLTSLCIITGDLLPWDQAGYWSTQVRLGIMASVPGVGDAAARFLKGGTHVGIVTLTRFYVFHILFLPAFLLLGIGVYVGCLARIERPSSIGTRASATNLLSPGWINFGLGLILLITLVLGAIAWQVPAPFGDPADPTDTTYSPRPAWWVLWLNQLVTLLRGPWQVLGTAVIPGALLMGLAALPWIDGASHHRVWQRTIQATMALIVLSVFWLSAMGYLDHHALPPAE